MAGQSQYSYGVLPEQSQEDALHASRLLPVEERPFQRVTRSLLGKDSPLKWTPKQLPSPPPDGEEALSQNEDEALKRQKISEDILLDFVALESSAIRIQLLQNSNQRERERYATEKAKILETAQAVRDNTIKLRAQLAEAQHILELRKGYDNLAKKLIPDDNKLKPRDVCNEDIEKLEKEIEDLQHESIGYEATWIARREAFDRVISEGQNMIKVIKGIKDEPEPDTEKDERMDDAEGDEEGTKGERSHVGTPLPDDATPLPEMIGGETPRPESSDDGPGLSARPTNKFLDVEDGTRSNSRASSPAIQAEEKQNDVDMGDSNETTQDLEPQEEIVAGTNTATDVATPFQEVIEMDET